MRRFGWVLIAVGALLGACTQPDEPSGAMPAGGPPTGTMAVAGKWSGCADVGPDPLKAMGAEELDLPRLGDGFTPVAAVVCTTVVEKRPDGSEALMATERRAEDIAALLAALRLPDEPSRTEGVCTLDLPTIPWVALVDADNRWGRPGVPGDACGSIRIEVRDAIAALRLTEVSRRFLRELMSSGAAASGCSQSWADMVWAETTMNPDRTWAPTLGSQFTDDDEIRLCVYAVPPGERGSAKPAGAFTSGKVLSAKQWAPIAAALRAAPKAAACSTPAERFALLSRTDEKQGEIYVELTGCQRIMTTPIDGQPFLGQADAALIALLKVAG